MSEIRLHASISNATVRQWAESGTEISPANLMYPVFVVENDDAVEEIPSMPGVKRYGASVLMEVLAPLVAKGLKSILIFGVVEQLPKDSTGSSADCGENPVIRVLPKIRSTFPNLLVACDVCLCPYTDHGHCGILRADGSVDNDPSVRRLAEIALAYAKAGAQVVAPSDMMDNRIKAIKDALKSHGLQETVSVLSYAVKFASGFYGPFRDAAKSAPAFGDRSCYQLPPGSRRLAARAAARDVAEGADMLMVKPGLAYLDLLRDTKNQFPNHPLFVYQVSGEYAMLHWAAEHGALDLRRALFEVLKSFRRSGADVIITYFTPLILNELQAGEN
ncbi:delta-aminolevulinic acid dehydratase [Phlebotomus argentipes]|uniref:delta-aminolevulinic acid dehydratase n=1 Tax=Phlebotomus argentipes TaxID=94469 RepID=UPI00289306B3|nr:delta-aminolevulinic acid dehydratase [Phlebotomus argentipes]